MDRLEIIETLKHLSEVLELELATVGESELRVRPAEGEWSIKEVVGHLSDFSGVQYKRFYMIWSLTDPLFPYYDEKAAAQAGNFNEASLETMVEALRQNRLKTVNLLDHAVDWSRLGQQPGVGRRTLKQFAERAILHDRNHLLQVRALKATATAANTA